MKAALKSLDRKLRKGRGDGTFGKRSTYWYLRNGARSIINHASTRQLTNTDVSAPLILGFVNRAGSTWVTQMVSQIPNVVGISDPLLERNAVVPARRYGFQLDQTYFWADQIAPATQYLRDTLALRARYSTLQGHKTCSATQTVHPFMKIANTPWLLPWFADTFGAEVRMLLRHPIDIARSQLNHWNMPPYLPNALPALTARGALPQAQLTFCQDVLDRGSVFDQRLAEVLLAYRPWWNGAPGGTVATLSYDRLRDGELDQLSFLSAWSPDWETHLRQGFDQPSKTTQGSNSLSARAPHTQAEIDRLNQSLDMFDAHQLMELL